MSRIQASLGRGGADRDLDSQQREIVLRLHGGVGGGARIAREGLDRWEANTDGLMGRPSNSLPGVQFPFRLSPWHLECFRLYINRQ